MKKLLSSLIIYAAVFSALLICAPCGPGLASPNSPLHAIQRNGPPLTRSQLEQWLALKPPARDEFIASYVARNGIDLQLTAEILARLEAMGYYRTLRALKARRSEPTPTPRPLRPARTPPPNKPGKKTPTEPVPDPDTITILVANFRGPDPENYLVTDKIIQGLVAATVEYPDIHIEPLGETITLTTGSKGGSAYARDIGTKRKASIVLWGFYGAPSEQVAISIYFEVLRPPRSLSLRQNLETQTLSIADLKGFKIQTRLSQEMSYLVLLTVGLARYESGDYEGAIDRFTKALAQSKAPDRIIDPADIYFYRGTAYYFKADANELDHAFVDFDEAIKLKPDLAEAYVSRGIIHARRGEYGLAMIDFNKAIELKPDLAEAYINHGTLYYKKGQYELAVTDYSKAIELNPDFAEAHFSRGAAYDRENKYGLAMTNYNKAIKLKPDFAEAYVNRGIIYAGRGDYGLAMTDYNKAVKFKPDFAEAYFNRGVAYNENGQTGPAITDYNRAIELKPDFAEAYINRAGIYQEEGEFDRAVADLKTVLRITNDPKLRQLAEKLLQEFGVK